MIYSCFDEQTGLYRYFEDARTVPVNGDLPVPTWLKGRVANGIGVPTADAGRPLPPDARPVGSGGAARGLMVQCQGSSLGLGEMPAEKKSLLLAGTAAALAAYFASSKQTAPALALGAVALGAYFL